MTTTLSNTIYVSLTLAAMSIVAAPNGASSAEFLMLDRSQGFPHSLFHLSDDGRLSFMHERETPVARELVVPALQSAAIGPNNEIYFVSGLDKRIYRLYRGRELLVYEHNEQVRDIAFDATGRLFFSALDTPQNGQRVDDCRIFSLDERSQRVRHAYTVRQRDLRAPCWGTFAFHDDDLYISTLSRDARGSSSSIYRIERGVPRTMYHCRDIGISDFAFSRSGTNVFFTDQTDRIFRLFKMRDLSIYLNVRGRRFSGLTAVQ